MNIKVFISYFEYPDVEIEKRLFKDAGFVVFDHRHGKEVDISEMVGEMDALLVQYVQVNKKVIDRLKKCRIIVRYGIGMTILIQNMLQIKE